MTLHKLSSGSGYQYLTRQVASLDSTEKGRTPLTGVSLGAAYQVYDNSGVDRFNAEVARRVVVAAETTGEPPSDVLARVRSEGARERFVAEHDREPVSRSELSDVLRRYSRPRQTAVAGYDETFSPVKSVSTLWTVAQREVAEAAHGGFVRNARAFIEREVLFTREGRNGARQVETRGLIATAFTHHDSRADDPDLRTEVAVAVANKVQTQQGKWLSIFGKVLHERVVAASERDLPDPLRKAWQTLIDDARIGPIENPINVDHDHIQKVKQEELAERIAALRAGTMQLLAAPG